MDSWLELLGSVGVDINAADWTAAHPHHAPAVAPEKRTAPGMDPLWTDADGMPYFSSSQIAWCHPEAFGIGDFGVVEDEETAHPFVLSYDDEQYYRANYRAKHRYSRPYRLRWTLMHVIGYYGKCNGPTLLALQERLKKERRDVINTRQAYEWVRRQLADLKQTRFNIGIPYLVKMLGGPGWKVSPDQFHAAVDEAGRVHRAFERAKGARQRFPKMQYVLLRALDRIGVAPPYFVKWARTSIKRRQLAEFLAGLDVDSNE